MALLGRIRDLVSANLNAMLDRAEDPQKMVDEYLRQLNDNLYEAKTSVASSMADETKLHAKMVQFQTEADQWQSKAQAAMGANDETLARQALSRKLQSQKLADSYKQQFEAQEQQVNELQDALVSLESRIAEARARRELIVAKQNRAQTQEAIQRTVRGISQTGAMDKLDQLESRVDDRLAYTDAMDKLNHGTLEAKFSDLEQNQELDAEMAALKKSMNPAS
ncbi:MAG: PspA/IM30 family protein [Herpetosiphonaceae bacterium]|nr:PspA/IM30 family protein [Herpetosiphonaceae bacterium]